MGRTYRIFHLIKGLGRGGAERLLADGIRHSDKTRFVYGYGYFLPWKNALVGELERAGAEVFCFQCSSTPAILLFANQLAHFIRRWKADLIHCHLPVTGIVGRLAGRMAGIPVLYTEHNVQERYHPVTRWLNLLTWKWQAGVIAVSNQVAASIDSAKTSPVALRVVQNGIPLDTFVRSIEDRVFVRHLFHIPENAVIIGTVAGFRRQKKLDDWLQAAFMILKAFPNVHFVIVGEGPLRNALETQTSSLGISERVHLAGLQENVLPFYSAFDIYMISSIFEGLPIALLEAMAMQLPIVTTAAGGIPEVVEDGSSGFIVDFNSPEQLSQKAAVLIQNSELRKTMGMAGRTIIEENFGIDRMVTEIETMYLEICESRIESRREVKLKQRAL